MAMVGYRCCVYNCKERRAKKGGISFHSFPRDRERRLKWIANIKKEGFITNDRTKICANHFEEDCFDREKFGKRWLKATAEPTIFNFPPPLQTSRNPSTNPESVLEDSHSLHHEQLETEISGKAVLPEKKRYSDLGDFDVDAYRAEMMKRYEITERVIELQKRSKLNMEMKEQRIVKKVANLSSMLKELKEKGLISETVQDTLEKSMSGVADEILRWIPGKNYSPEVRRFALTFYFYSSEAYNYARNFFNTCLPPPSTLRRWCGVVRGSPAFSKEALTTFQLKAAAESFLFPDEG